MIEATRYFAYGSNLSSARLAERGIVPSRAVPARLSNYRLCFNKRSHKYRFAANIVEHVGTEVWGAVYDITAGEIERLDGHEQVHSGHYRRQVVRVETDNDSTVAAFVYRATPEFEVAPGIPSHDYLRYLLSGARELGLPDHYVRNFIRQGTSSPRTAT